MELISVIVPSYNASVTLERSLGSVLKQTYANFELLVVNDGSLDETSAIVHSFEKKDSRVRLIEAIHGGVSAARNRGLDEAKGDYVFFLDADDDIVETTFEKMISALKENAADMAICDFSHPIFRQYSGDGVYDLRDPFQLLRLYGDTFTLVTPWNKLIKRSIIGKTRFDVEVHFSEDELFNLAILPSVKRVVTIKDCLYHYFFATKENSRKEDSCLNGLINGQLPWITKTSIWYLGDKVLSKREAILRKAIKENKLSVGDINDLLYTRAYDYCFWELLAYLVAGMPHDFLYGELSHVFCEPDYVKSVKVQEHFGFRFLDMSDEEREKRLNLYVNLCCRTVREKFAERESFKISNVLFGLYAKLFLEPWTYLNDVNFTARRMIEILENSTPEARYANSICPAPSYRSVKRWDTFLARAKTL
jgi:glycosyltransferase involved in cell wall biosynthesis